MMASSKKVKDSEAPVDHEHLCGLIPWPPKNYNCSFCKREFRSAQALGGHMNVHRRDRARLRMLPRPWPLVEYRNPNPSFASSSSSSSARPKSLVSPSLVTSLPSSPPSSSSFANEEKKRLLECTQQNAMATPSEGLIRKKKNMRAAFGSGKLKELAISLDLEMGLKDSKEAVDLELRLGYYYK